MRLQLLEDWCGNIEGAHIDIADQKICEYLIDKEIAKEIAKESVAQATPKDKMVRGVVLK